MQGHRGLARTRPAIDDQDGSGVGADHPVLFGLQRRDDVVHVARAGRGQRLQQRGVTARPGHLGGVGGGGVEHVVGEAA